MKQKLQELQERYDLLKSEYDGKWGEVEELRKKNKELGEIAYEVSLVRDSLEKKVEELKGGIEELLEVAELRGDNQLPSPPDDPKLWTARMQEAWDNMYELIALPKQEDVCECISEFNRTNNKCDNCGKKIRSEQ